MKDEYCWTIFVDQLLAGVYTDKQKAIEHLCYLIDCFPGCIKRHESDWLIKYISDDGQLPAGLACGLVTSRLFQSRETFGSLTRACPFGIEICCL